MVLSILSSKSIEEVNEACNGEGLRWMQIQPFCNRDHIFDIVRRAERNNYKALVVTCDDPGERRQFVFLRDGYKVFRTKLGNFPTEVFDYIFENTDTESERFYKTFGKHLVNNWDYIDWLRSITSLPIVLKGILDVEDAKEALKHNIQGIIVSNHGGRVLDDVPATVG